MSYTRAGQLQATTGPHNSKAPARQPHLCTHTSQMMLFTSDDICFSCCLLYLSHYVLYSYSCLLNCLTGTVQVTSGRNTFLQSRMLASPVMCKVAVTLTTLPAGRSVVTFSPVPNIFFSRTRHEASYVPEVYPRSSNTHLLTCIQRSQPQLCSPCRPSRRAQGHFTLPV